jgi:hypothetical protein
MTSNIVDIDQVRKNREKKRWNRILLEIEQQIKLREQDGPVTLMEQKGMKNFKNLVKKLRQKHCGED